jgi:thiol-disulfide isomerase/thioredoxin
VLSTLVFSAGEIKDINRNNGYMVSVRDKQGKIRQGTYVAYAEQYDGLGNYLYGLPTNADYAFNYKKQEWNEFPSNRSNITPMYMQALYTKKKKEAEPEILQLMADMEAAGNLTENQYNTLSSWYQRLGQKDKSAALKAEMKEKYPSGNWKKGESLNAFYAEADPAKKEEVLLAHLKAYPPVTENDKTQANYYYSSLATSFAQPKDETKRDIEKFKLYAAKLPVEMKASLYNNVSWNLAKKDISLDLSKEISEIATKWAKNEITAPTSKKPAMATTKAWGENRKNTYAMYADTYGYIMYKLKNYKEGFPYVKEAAVDIKKKKDPEYNDRYALLLEHVVSPAEVQKELEPLMKDGKLGKESRDVLRRSLVSNLKSEQKADDYLAVLMKAAAEKAREEMMKKMINEESVGFNLKNIQGNEVSLASLKGKVVVLDFWATWCGPCIASFPGMQKAVNKYKDNENVAFLFIDTWESQETMDLRKKEVSDFIAKNKYTFNVLYDEKVKDDPNNFVVVNDYKVTGIPTKFIIDKAGKIRFKSVGFSGAEDGLVDEISAMIELADSK